MYWWLVAILSFVVAIYLEDVISALGLKYVPMNIFEGCLLDSTSFGVILISDKCM